MLFSYWCHCGYRPSLSMIIGLMVQAPASFNFIYLFIYLSVLSHSHIHLFFIPRFFLVYLGIPWNISLRCRSTYTPWFLVRVNRAQISRVHPREAQLTLQKTHCASKSSTKHSMPFKRIIAVYSENRTKFLNELHRHNDDLLMLKNLVHIVVTVLGRDDHTSRQYILY
jgi:hypothetical protein